MTAPAALCAYLAASQVAPLVLRPMLRRRASRGKEETGRLAEREGFEAGPRPPGPCLWAHGASIGETVALLGLLERLQIAQPTLGGVVTTGTVTAARLIAPRLPPGFCHRYAPLDARPWVERFLDGWQPALALRVDSEIWPAALEALDRRGVPRVLVNGRLSQRSATRWAALPSLARYLFGGFAAIAAQDEASAGRFRALGAPADRVSCPGPLKGATPPPAADPAALAAVESAIAGRPVFLAASTHPGEEAVALTAARAVARELPTLLTVIAPRHPDRGAAIAADAAAAGLPAGRRGAGDAPGQRPVYVADTLGEMGMWYRLAPVAFIGGSIAPLGGHNPYEAAALDVALATGPLTANFAEAFERLAAVDACHLVRDAEALAGFLRWAFSPDGTRSPAASAAAARAAQALAPDPAPLDACARLVTGLLPPC